MRVPIAFSLMLLLSACANTTMSPNQPSDMVYGQSASSSCDTQSRSISLGIYANEKDQDFSYPRAEYDRSRPLILSSVKIGTQNFMTNLFGYTDVPRELLKSDTPLKVEGFHAASFYGDQPCSKYYVALSPLSQEEKQGQEQTLEKESFRGLIKGMKQDAGTGFYYGVIKNEAALDRLAPEFKDDNLVARLRGKLQASKQVIVFSNGSQGLGDVYDTIHRFTRLNNTAILASHLSSVHQDPQPMGPYGDRFSEQTEMVSVPASLDTTVFDVLTPGAGGGEKKRLEIKLASAEF